MKVLDLHCSKFHIFEGWFASEGDYASQSVRGLVTCPVCGDAVITKRLSAPRLNLGGVRGAEGSDLLGRRTSPSPVPNQPLSLAWQEVAMRILASTEDVGSKFASEARKIYYGESVERGIRGRATREETQSLLEEGIQVMPLLVPDEPNDILH